MSEGREFFERLLPAGVDSTCGWCRRDVEMRRASERGVVPEIGDVPEGKQAVVGGLYACPRRECGRPTLVFFDAVYNPRWGGDPRVQRFSQFPRGAAQEMQDLPEPIERDRLEAWRCYFGGDVRAAAIMARAAVQRAARHLDAEGAGLKAEIKDLADKGVITRELKAWADEVRITGDDAAHPEDLGEVRDPDARESLDFMDEFLRHSVAMPERRRRREEARRQSRE